MTRPAPIGVRWISAGPGDGYGDAALQYLSALDALGIPVTWTPLAWSYEPRGLAAVDHYDGPLAHLAHRRIEHDVVVVQLPLDQAHGWLGEGRGRRMVAYTTWETDRVPEGWAELAEAYDAVLVPSSFNRDAFVAAASRTVVHVVPHVVTQPAAVEPARYPGMDERFVFYTIGTWSTRKAMPDTVNAFLDAFGAADDVGLVVKTSGHDLQAVQRMARGLPAGGPERWPFATWPRVASLVAGRRDVPRIHLVADAVPAGEIAALHARGDCFVALTRAEGWGLCISDALAADNPAVVTGWGGQLDYLGTDYPLLVDYDLVPTVDDPSDAWFEGREGYRWARARHDHAVDVLRWVATHRDEAAGIGRDVGNRIVQAFGAERVGPGLLSALSAAAPGTAPGAQVGRTAEK